MYVVSSLKSSISNSTSTGLLDSLLCTVQWGALLVQHSTRPIQEVL